VAIHEQAMSQDEHALSLAELGVGDPVPVVDEAALAHRPEVYDA
jgi:hypothetical protein